MHTFKTITLALMLIIFSVTGLPAEDISFEQLIQLHEEGKKANNIADYHTALKKYEQGLKLARQAKHQLAIIAFIGNIGVVYSNLGQYQKALDSLQQALSIDREIGNRRGEGGNLGNIGNVYYSLGQYKKALDYYYQQALSIARETGDRRRVGNNLTNIGNVYYSLGQYQKALDYYQQALEIHRKIGDRRGVGTDLTNIGIVYDSLGQYKKALDYYQQSLEISREINDRRGVGSNLTHIGIVYNSLGQNQKALDYYQQASEIKRKIGDKRGIGNNLINIGMVYDSLGKNQKALDYYQQALVIAQAIGNRSGQWKNLTNIGVVYKKLGKYQKAKDIFQNSIVILEIIGSDNLWQVQRNLASTEAKLNQPELAIQHYEQALDNLEKLRTGITEKEHRLSFMRGKLYVYDEFITLLQSLHTKHPKNGYDRKAFETFERKQGRVFLEEMGKSSAWHFAGVPENISQKDREFEQQIATARKNRNQALEKGLDAEPHRQRLEKLEVEQQAFEKTLETDYPAYYALKYPKPVDLATLQNQVLQQGEMVLVYNVIPEISNVKLESQTILWVIGKQQFQMLTLDITEEELQAKVEAFRQSPNTLIKAIKELPAFDIPDVAEDNLPQLRQAGYELYQSLMPAKAKTLIKDARTLYIVPTGPLYDLPFGALETHDPNQHEQPHYLIQDYPIVYLSSASLLKIIRDTERDETSARYPFLAFADPEYPKNCGISQTNEIQSARTEAYLKLAGSDNAVCFVELPETRKQATAITELLKAPENSQPLQLRAKASKSNVFHFHEQQRLDDYQYVLFAAHAVLPNEISYINQPAIVLSNPHTEGYLKMADVFALQMNADLVMLSACNTGRGEKIKGEGVRGLTRAFMYAGTPAVSVSLWDVESSSAKNLSVALFEYLQQGKPLAQALRQSKLDLIANEDMEMYQHPYFWAPFVVFGDGG